MRNDPAALENALVDLLAGPCRDSASGKPLLLLIDDLEHVLEPGERGVHSVQREARPALRAVLHAFDPARGESRLLVTSRFRFSLVDDGVELADKLWPLQLPPFNETAQRKLTLRQQDAARSRREPGMALDDATLATRLPLLERAQQLACGNPGLQDLLGDRLVLRRAVPQARIEAVLEQTAAYLGGGELPEGEEVREFMQNLALDQLLEEASTAGQALLRSLLLFRLPIPVAVAQALAEEIGGAPDVLLALGLLDPFADLVDRTVAAVAANALAAGRLAPLSAAEQKALLPLGLSALFAAWGAEEGRTRRPYTTDIELTRLGLLVPDTQVVACCAANAVRGLKLNYQSIDAARWGQAAIAALEQASQTPPLALLARTGAALRTIGEGGAADEVLGKGADRLGDAAAEASLDPVELRLFYFELGNHRLMRGDSEGAQTAYTRMGELAAAHGDEHSVAVTQGKIADILFDCGQLDEALRILKEEVLSAFTRLGAVREIAVTQGRIAQILSKRGDLNGALELDQALLAAYRKLQDQNGIAAALWDIAQIERKQEKWSEAIPHIGEAWQLFLKLGRAEGIAVVGEF
jgi:tetratricopeptide (TPR) repeat protein